MIHGHQIVPWDSDEQFLQLQREHDVDVIVTGHTKESSYRKIRELHVINPGSAASYSNLRGEATQPSFALLKLNTNKTGFVYIYKCSTEEGKKIDIQKYDLAAELERIDVETLTNKEEVSKAEEPKVEEPVVKESEVSRQIVSNYDDEGSDEDYE